MVMMVGVGLSLMVALVLVALLLVAQEAAAFGSYRGRIPNGYNVRDENGNLVNGVGHVNSGGGGSQNQFGKDFKSAGKSWTTTLCNQDSDGDGFSNGVELGDPDCEWSSGQTPQFEEFITHPGVAGQERVSATLCDEYVELPTASGFDATYPNFAVPSAETTYAKYSINATELLGRLVTRVAPIIDQEDVVHHMLLYQCEIDTLDDFTSPADGPMVCTDLIFSWAVGGDEYCFPSGTGLLMTLPVLILEIHYDNPSELSGIVDSSGLEIISIDSADAPVGFEPAAWAWTGPAFSEISIAPGLPYFEIASQITIPSDVAFPVEGVTVFTVASHAHKIGVSVWSTVQRAATPGVGDAEDEEGELFLSTCNPRFDYNLQELTVLDTSFQLFEGDTVTVHCVYDSTERTGITIGADSTNEEMCMAMFLFKPALPGINLRVLTAVGVQSSTEPLALADAALSCPAAVPAAAQIGLSEWWGEAPSSVRAHGLLLILAWFVLVPLGTIAPMLFKGNPANSKWFLAHRVFMTLGAALTLVAVAMIVEYKPEEAEHLESTHGRVGALLVAAVLLQLSSGILRPHKGAPRRRAWELGHWWGGRALVVAAASNALAGVHQYELYAGEADVSSSLQYGLAAIAAVWVLFSAGYYIAHRGDAEPEQDAVVHAKLASA